MTAVTYTAKRSLATGHTVDVEYTIDLRSTVRDPDKNVGKEESASLNGNTETVMWRNLRIWQATTAALRGTELELALEFLESTIAGERFDFDEFGSAAAADNPLPAIIAGVYRRQRAIRQGDGGADDYFRFSFAVREVP